MFNTSTSELTGKACSPNHVQWAYDTYALAGSTARALLKDGGDTWFLIQADYTFGATLGAEARAVIEAGGGKVLGTVKHPFPGTTDFSQLSAVCPGQRGQGDRLGQCGHRRGQLRQTSRRVRADGKRRSPRDAAVPDAADPRCRPGSCARVV